MTFTATYIKMMSQSPIQKEWKPKVGDWYFYKKLDAIIVSIFSLDDREGKVWLPTLDDWWEMIQLSIDKELAFYRLKNGDYYLRVTTIEDNYTTCYYEGESIFELLSAFYHSERGLEWRDERWV